MVDIDAVSPDLAGRMTNGLLAATNARFEGGPARVQAVYDETAGRLKVIATGSLATTSGLLQLLSLYLEQPP